MGCAYSAPNPVQAALAPPIQIGHPLLGQLVEVLRAEYEMRQPQSVGRWLDTVNEAEFARAGCNKRAFEDWCDDRVEQAVRRGFPIENLAVAWGVAAVAQPMQQQQQYAQMPVAQGQVAYAQPVTQPMAAPVAQPVGQPYGQPGEAIATAMPIGGGVPMGSVATAQPMPMGKIVG